MMRSRERRQDTKGRISGRHQAWHWEVSCTVRHDLSVRFLTHSRITAFLANFISVGVANTLGVVLHGEEYDSSSPFLNVDHFKMGFVAGTAIGFSFSVGPFSNVSLFLDAARHSCLIILTIIHQFLITRLGIRAPVALGVLLMTFALEMASLATQFWQLLLSQGILWGIGSSLCFIPAIGLPSQWFQKRKGIATGFASAGAPVGAMILSPSFEAIIARLGVQWALRILGFILLGVGSVVVALVHPKRRGDGTSMVSHYKMFDMEVIKTRGYALYMLFALIQMFGYVTPIYWLPNYARTLGLSSHQGANVIVILNAGNFVGRIGSGQLGDRLGALNVLSLFTFLGGLLCVVAWMFVRTFAGLAAFAAFWGMGAGAYWALTVPCTARIVGLPRLGSAVSINFLMNFAPPVFAPSIGTALITAASRRLNVSEDDPVAFRYLIIWSGLAYMVPAILLVIVRFTLERRLFQRI